MMNISRRQLLKAAGALPFLSVPSLALPSSYRVVPFTSNEGHQEYRCYHNQGHFLSVLATDPLHHIFAIRPHPDAGPNDDAWGSTWYLQPFLPGAVLDHSSVESVAALQDHVQVAASGKVSYQAGITFGNWNATLMLSYDPSQKKIQGSGTYAITLDDALANAPSPRKELNLCKIASNYLVDVPLLSGGRGFTGDMKEARVQLDDQSFIWIPHLQPAHFPQDSTDILDIEVRGRYNEVDTAAMGQSPINPAYKPNLKVGLRSSVSMIFGGFFDQAKAQDFTADNIGITPLVTGPGSVTQIVIQLDFESIPSWTPPRTPSVSGIVLY